MTDQLTSTGVNAGTSTNGDTQERRLAHSGEPAEGSSKKPRPAAPNWENILPVVVGFGFWVLIICGAVYAQFRGERADILLDFSSDLVASGRVLYGGTTMSAGLVHVAVDEQRTQRRLASAVAEVKDGAFTTQALGDSRPSALGVQPPLKVTAQYFGQIKPKGTPQDLRGETVVFVNAGPPLGASAWWVGALATLALVVLILVFTSRAGMRRVRLLFQVMYLITFLSLVLPILLTVLLVRNPYLVEMMREAPIGLVNAKAPGSKDPQWLINIGGTVVPGDTPRVPAAEVGGAPVVSSSIDTTTPSSPAGGAQAVDGGPRVSGGIAVPLYLVLLAMFGAAVNLTRRVPEIQKKAESLDLGEDIGLLAAPFLLVFGHRTPPPATANLDKWADIRRELVQNYMYLLSAPVLAVAVYYILQIVANEVTQPVLVLGSFAAGLASESTIKYVMDFADNKIKYA